MATWGEFSKAAPELAADGRRLFYRTETGEAMLATVRRDLPPRLHPIYLAVLDDRLVAFILASAKRRDLEEDGRYALHAHVDPAAPSEFSVRGRARLIDDDATRAGIGDRWYFQVDESYELFEFSIESAVMGRRDSADEWPPRYTTWREGDDHRP